jgi:hypothetical protein
MKFEVVITRDGEEYVARCPELPDTVARGSSVQHACENIAAVIREKFRREGGTDDGTAPTPHPVSPLPRGPIAARCEPPRETDS